MPDVIIRTADGTHRIAFEGQPLLYDLIAHLPDAPQRPCGGHGTCGKCRVRASGGLYPPPDGEGYVLACRTRLVGDAEVNLSRRGEMTQIEVSTPEAMPRFVGGGSGFGSAGDLGTTTIALRLYDLASGDMLASVSGENPQRAVAADVIGRIESAMQGNAAVLQNMVRSAVDALEAQAFAAAGCKGSVRRRVIAGNTTMLYLYTGRDPKSLSRAPFEADCLFGTEQGIEALPACMGAFVGADITCGVLASGMMSRQETAMLVDIGTNGEIVLQHAGKLYCCATAAGPAFEGAGITCGVGSVPGAVKRVWADGDGVAVETVDGAHPCGICGSGLLDLIAVLLEAEIIDESGAMDADFVIADGVYLTPQDVRQVQLAKGAIAAGMQVLMKRAGISAADVQRLYIAGGFGSRLSLTNAALIGLIPAEFVHKAEVLGNASLGGASMLLNDPAAWGESLRIAALAQCLNLAADSDFFDLYIENMLFE